jgi:hypothetical protein
MDGTPQKQRRGGGFWDLGDIPEEKLQPALVEAIQP